MALVERHFPESAELALIAVSAPLRATGVGRALVTTIEDHLRADGCDFLEVHTVGPAFEHAGYAATRAFYRAVGFAPMHEFDGLDWAGPTLVMIKSLRPASRSTPESLD
ncbi:MAG: GNAT family N-acetyltransferase [Micropruina sp.]|uniref:GNAT family N-acetyltransferase n=1 Tax=Micropruina sp. TaxID=2737536 RepID=UPI0039E3E008